MDENMNRFYVDHQTGRNFWKLLHTTAAYYPEKPTQHEQAEMKFYMAHAADYYLLNEKWKDEWHNQLEEKEPQTSSQQDLSLWLCHQHNAINYSLGRELFDCSPDVLKRRWGPYTK